MKKKIKLHQNILISFLESQLPLIPVNAEKAENQLIIDKVNHHYLLVELSWEGKKFRYDTVFHFDIKANGKIWIMANATDVDITRIFMSQGVSNQDIVLGFHHAELREASGFAVA